MDLLWLSGSIEAIDLLWLPQAIETIALLCYQGPRTG